MKDSIAKAQKDLVALRQGTVSRMAAELGEDHTITLRGKQNLADVLVKHGDVEGAEALALETLAVIQGQTSNGGLADVTKSALQKVARELIAEIGDIWTCQPKPSTSSRSRGGDTLKLQTLHFETSNFEV